MERVSVLCLLLLLCSLTGAELQDNEIIEQGKVSPERVNVPEQLYPCLSDLHAVLREMSAKLAKHEVRIEQLQTLNQEQAAKLKELEKQSSHMDTQQRAQTAALHRLEAWSNVTETQVQTLKRDRAVGQVAFSASLLASGSGHTGPFNAHTPLVFRHVVSNIGNDYSPNTGFFTAPVRGAYHFEFYIFAGAGSSGAALVKNGEHVFIAYAWDTSGDVTSANGATLLLEAGDVVFLRLWANSRIYDDGNHRSTFSGHLLFPM